MKTNILAIAIIIIGGIVAVNFDVNAQGRHTVVYANVIGNDETGITKELVIVNKNTKKASKKKVYKYNNEGCPVKMLYYEWNSLSGWMPIKKREYVYSEDRLLSILYTEWDGIGNKWSDKSEYMVYDYKNDGSLSGIKLHNINRTKDILHAQMIR